MKLSQPWGTSSLLLVFLASSSFYPVPAGAVPPVSFAAKTDFATESAPFTAAIADLNHDGAPDVAVTSTGSNTVSVLLGDGAGGLMARTDFATGANPHTVAIGDLNGDHNPDLALSNLASNTVSVLLGDGLGGFGPRSDFPTGDGPRSVAIGDLDRDGDLDLVTANWSSTDLSVLLGDGAGGFGPRTDFATGGFQYWVAIGDLNGDGIPDLVTANLDANDVSVLLGTGDGSFGAHTEFATGEMPAMVAIGDLDGDGVPDLAVANVISNTISVLPGTGTGSFGPGTEYATGGHPTPVAIADLNGDGIPDLVTTNYYDNSVSVLRGAGAGNFESRTDFPTGIIPGYLAIGDLDGDGRLDLAVPNYSDNTVSVLLNTSGTTIAPQPPATCITPAHACVEVPVAIAREEATPMRAYSVDVQLSGNLALCPPPTPLNITEGTYLGGGGGGATSFQIIHHGGGSYTVDCAILGLPCGATAPSGTLFTLHLASSASGGTGTVTVTGVMLRDCDNGPIAAFAGAPASITIDNEAPAEITALAASQQKTGNSPTDSTTAITLSWPAVEAGAGVELWRTGFGNYPEYDDPPGAGSVPAPPGSYPPAGWTLAATVSGPTSYADHPDTRDFWYYVAYVVDPCGNVSAVSNRTDGTLDYHLGDVANGAPGGTGNNRVATEDISMLGANYGITLIANDPVHTLDVGPTTDYSVDARPTTDNKVDFEDLVMFAINYGGVSAPQSAARLALVPATTNAVRLTVPALPAVGETFAVGVMLESAGAIQGLSLDLAYDAAVVEPLGVEPGGLLLAQEAPGLALSARPGGLDVALLGTNRTIVGAGEVARMVFRVKGSGPAAIALARLEARDTANRPVALQTPVRVPDAARPASTVLMAARPNPFAGVTTLSFALAQEGPVELAIYAVDGRKVATVVRETRAAGTYSPVWDGRDARGVAVQPGIYYARLVTPAGRFNRTLVLMK